jgi:hypothetical protein
MPEEDGPGRVACTSAAVPQGGVKMNDRVDKNFDSLVEDGMLKREGLVYRLTDKGVTRAVKELYRDKLLDFHALRTEIEAGETRAARSRCTVAAKKWTLHHRALAGTPNHIIIGLLGED